MREYLWWEQDKAKRNPHTFKHAAGAREHIIFGTDEKPMGLVSNIERFQKMLDTNNVPGQIRDKA